MEPDPPLSEAARELDDHVRELASDLTDLDLRREKKRNFTDRTRRLFSNLVGEKRLNRLEHWDIPPALFVLVILFVLLIVFLGALLVRGSDDATTTTAEPVITQSAAIPSDDVEPVASGAVDADQTSQLSGTWVMFWRNDNDVDREAFTLRFSGSDTGTVEVLNDEGAFDTSFELEDDRLSFGFTRMFEPPAKWPENNPYEGWPEKSTFEGTRVSDGQFLGKWYRDDWECRPERNPPCVTKPDPDFYTAWLERQP